MQKKVLEAYSIFDTTTKIEAIRNGLINSTWKISHGKKEYVLQKINTNVFKKTKNLFNNLEAITNHLSNNHPNYFFAKPILCKATNNIYYKNSNEYYRLFEFVKNSKTVIAVQNEQQAFEAAKQFGKFTAQFHDFNTTALKDTIPNFHNLALRYTQFEKALTNATDKRLKKSSSLIKQCKDLKYICSVYKVIVSNKEAIKRVTHHDTKISNVLFNKNNKGICVIDLDTTMQGYFFSDIGDMMRTYLCKATEEEKDFTKIKIRKKIYDAILKGYTSSLKLTNFEKENMHNAGSIIIYMQALRFLTDYLNNDIYYGKQYEDHNLIRAKNQLVLLRNYFELLGY